MEKVITKIQFLLFTLTLLLVPLNITGCSTSSTRQTTTTITEEPTQNSEQKTKVIEKTETITETEESCGGILSCTVDVIGAVIALPFKAVGFLIGVIF